MSKKAKEIQLQSELETTEEFEEMLGREGLTVVDVYQEWCGPCKSIVSNFRKLKNELGDDMLKFSTAKADTIDWLAEYRGQCEPCFLFFATGCLVSIVRGANAPLLMKTITDQLKQEHRVLEGLAERKEIVDLRHKDPETEVKEEVKKKEVTIAIIKPDAVKAGHVDSIISEMKDMGIEILEKQERNLSEEEAREFYSHVEGEEFYEDLITFMTSGHCILLVLSKGNTGQGIIDEWKSLLGPKSVEEAKETMPESLRAKYGKNTFFNALHGSDTHETASRELGFFFPRYVVPKAVTEKPEVQRTLALIRPELLMSKKDEILEKIKEAGFIVAMQKTLHLDKEQIEFFYSEHKDQPYFEGLVNNMSKGPIMALALARDDAVKGWRDILGPRQVDAEKDKDTLRATYQIQDSEALNQIHGSANVEEAKSEIEYFFPKEQTLAVIKPDGYDNRDHIIDKIKEAGFHIAARKHVSLTKDIAQEFYRGLKDEECFTDLTSHMTSGKTLCMVLTKQDAIEGWRNMIGPKNPDDAKSDTPLSIRSLYGTDTIANAVHGSSNNDEVKNNIKLIFGEPALEGIYNQEDQPDKLTNSDSQVSESDNDNNNNNNNNVKSSEEEETAISGGGDVAIDQSNEEQVKDQIEVTPQAETVAKDEGDSAEQQSPKDAEEAGEPTETEGEVSAPEAGEETAEPANTEHVDGQEGDLQSAEPDGKDDPDGGAEVTDDEPQAQEDAKSTGEDAIATDADATAVSSEEAPAGGESSPTEDKPKEDEKPAEE